MIEAESMLHLRRYLTLVVRSQLRSPRCEMSQSRQLRYGGYVFRYMHPRHACLRPEISVTTCSRMYSMTVLQSSPSDVIDHKLMSFCNDVKKGRMSANSLREVIDLCSKNNYHLPHDTGVFLLKCCGNLLSDLEATERDHLANQVWCLAKKNNKAMTLEHYNTLLSINEENSKFVNPKQFLEHMSVTPDESTYRLLLNTAAKADNSEYLWDILSIIDKNTVVYEEAINTLIQICATNGDIAKVERAITLLQEAKLSTAKAYNELACGYAKLGNIPNLVKVLNDEPQSNANLLRIIKVLSMSNNNRNIPVVLNFLMTSVAAIEFEMSKLIVELIRDGRVADAQTIINCFSMNNVANDIVQGFVNSFMNELVISNAPVDDIIKYANDFMSSGCSKHILTDVAEMGLKLQREKLCLTIFQAMRNKNVPIRPHYYWPLLLKAYHNKGEAEIFSLVKSMINDGVEIDSDTLLHYVFPYVNTVDPIITLQKLQLINVPNSVSYTPLLSFLLYHNRLQDLTSLSMYYTHYKVYFRDLIIPLVHAYLDTKDFKSCVVFLTTFPQGQDFVGLFLKLLLRPDNPFYIEDLQFLLEEFKNCETKISQEHAIMLKDVLKQNENFNVLTKVENLIDDLVDPDKKSSATTLHPKYMNTKELTYFLIELQNNKSSTKSILNRLLIMHCIENNLKKAEEIKRNYDACQYEWTSSMKSLLFELYLKHDKLNDAEALLSSSPDKFDIDKIKTVMYATALVKADKPTKALDVIDTFNVTDIKADAQAHCCTLLETLAESRYYARTDDMLNLLLKNNYCQITVELLKPLIAVSLKYNNILDTINVFVKCAQKYYQAPLALRILTILLEHKYNSKLSNADDYIDQVYNVTATLHSVNVANTLLAMALATMNKTEKLQVLLQNYKLSMNCLIFYINNAKTDSDMDGLQTLFEIADANRLNQKLICNVFLSAYSKMGDCNRALQLWKIMCTKNIEPTKRFKRSLSEFLLSNKIPFPPELNEIK